MGGDPALDGGRVPSRSFHHEADVVRDPAEGVVWGVTADPDDDYLVGLAGTLEGASYLVSVDRHLLDFPDGTIRGYQGAVLARILTPGQFLRELERAD